MTQAEEIRKEQRKGESENIRGNTQLTDTRPSCAGYNASDWDCGNGINNPKNNLVPGKQNITAQGHPEVGARPGQWLPADSGKVGAWLIHPKFHLPRQHPHTARVAAPCLAVGMLGQQEPRALPWLWLVGLRGAPPSLPLCPTLGICLL